MAKMNALIDAIDVQAMPIDAFSDSVTKQVI